MGVLYHRIGEISQSGAEGMGCCIGLLDRNQLDHARPSESCDVPVAAVEEEGNAFELLLHFRRPLMPDDDFQSVEYTQSSYHSHSLELYFEEELLYAAREECCH